MIRKTTNIRRREDGLAGSLAYVFLQIDAQGIGRKASGCDYAPQRRALTTQERREARQILREQLRASVALLQGSKGSGSQIGN